MKFPRFHNASKWATLVPAAVLTGLILILPLPTRLSQPAHKTIHVDASQFSYSPGEIRVNRGDIVTLELASLDVAHGLYLDGYGISVTADPGQSRRLTFTADRPGAFRFRCNITCGAMHPFMVGKLVVGQDQWLARALALIFLAVLTAGFLRPRLGTA